MTTNTIISSAEELVAAMSVAPPPPPLVRGKGKFHRETTRSVYEGYADGKKPTGRFYITFSGGEATRAAVQDALRRGLIAQTWDCEGHWSLPEEAAVSQAALLAAKLRK